ncbi:hypothetical protein [[Phormidium] sp. ETS-05]|uniref:hypothetical protein n=1 Tax=[Phormidium] sp. ETS-05 TaxID=222819 RepID=UPI0018EEEE6E|nr:hypothetical protein [[Phormidium] sp. ETS-05]
MAGRVTAVTLPFFYGRGASCAGEQGGRGAGEQGSRGAGEQGGRGAGGQGGRGAGDWESPRLPVSPSPRHPVTLLAQSKGTPSPRPARLLADEGQRWGEGEQNWYNRVSAS